MYLHGGEGVFYREFGLTFGKRRIEEWGGEGSSWRELRQLKFEVVERVGSWSWDCGIGAVWLANSKLSSK